MTMLRGGGALRSNLVVLLAVGLALAVGLSGCVSSAESERREAVEVLPPEPRTPPLSYEGFEAGNIISDEAFFNTDSMTEHEVAEFIRTWNDGCRTGRDGTQCLAKYVEDTPTYPADQYCPGGFDGREGDSAASIIWRAAQSCGINPQVLLVTLQKEQGLITASSFRLNETRYAIAMGYGCPDSTQCDAQFYGFANQVYHAARQMRIYEALPWQYLAAPQQTSKIKFAYPEECGGAEVFVQNQATANLYNYTPYQPNQNALMGVRGECESPGNLNFYAYFNAWFGEAA